MHIRIELLRGLYAAMLKHDEETKNPEYVSRAFDTFWSNVYVRKWMDLEQRFRSNGIDVRASNGRFDATGLAVNMQTIGELLAFDEIVGDEVGK